MYIIRNISSVTAKRVISKPSILNGFERSLTQKMELLDGFNLVALHMISEKQRSEHLDRIEKLTESLKKMYFSFLAGYQQALESSEHVGFSGRNIALLNVRRLSNAVAIQLRNILKSGVMAQIGEAKRAIEDAACENGTFPEFPSGMNSEVFIKLSALHRNLQGLYDYMVSPRD